MNVDAELCADLAGFYADPLSFVMYAYPWDTDPALQVCELPAPYNKLYDCKYGPDKWACDFLTRLGEQIKGRGFDGIHAVDAIREAIASGHGIGKSAMVAWLVDFIMSTRPHAKGIVTANTAPQLSSKTWAEIAKWTKKCITSHWFEVTTGTGHLRMYHKQHPDSWQCVGQTWDEHNAEAFAGLHAANSTPFYIFDEASKIADKIADVAEGGLTDGEPMFFKFGNPTRNSGDFYKCFHGMRHRWHCTQIDSRHVAITNKAQIAQWVADYGEDSDFVKVRVRGVFPSMSAKQFISTLDVDTAIGRHLKPEQYSFAPVILTCDPAWSGDDDLVISKRQGLAFSILKVIAKNDNDVEIANILARLEDEHKADAVFVDGGYGTGIVSAGRTMGRDWTIVWFSGASSDPGCLNKRAQMWKEARDWLKEGGALPDDNVLRDDLIGPETVPRMDGKIQLESKEDMKRRGLPSPNRADALVLSFAYPVTARTPLAKMGIHQPRNEYDPYAVVKHDRPDPLAYNPYNS